MTERQDLAVASAIGRVWERLQAEDDRIPDIVVDLTPGRSSSCGSVGWAAHPVLEVNLIRDGETVSGKVLLEYLLHQAAHSIAGAATTAEGRYHDQAYRDAAESLGLDVRHLNKAVGFGDTSLATGTLTRYQKETGQLSRALAAWEPTLTRKGQRGPAKIQCSCDPPRILRGAEGTVLRAPITCGACGQPFRIVEG